MSHPDDRYMLPSRRSAVDGHSRLDAAMRSMAKRVEEQLFDNPEVRVALLKASAGVPNEWMVGLEESVP